MQIRTILESLNYVVAIIVFPLEQMIFVEHRLVLCILSFLIEFSPLSLRRRKAFSFSFSRMHGNCS